MPDRGGRCGFSRPGRFFVLHRRYDSPKPLDMRFIIAFSMLSIVALLIDIYVYRNWRRFAKHRRRLQWTLGTYRAAIVLFSLLLPAYGVISSWWAAEPAGARSAVMGIWVIYYLPKLLIALVLGFKDIGRFTIWLFAWFREQLAPPEPPQLALAHVPAAASADPLDLSDMKRLTRSEFLRKMGWSAASVPFVVVGYSVFKSLYDFDIYHVSVPIAGLPRQLDGLRIAQISDLHAGSLFSDRPMHEAVDLIHRQHPDIITLTGDFVNHDAAEAPVILPALDRLRAPLGVYGCLGNHDHYANVHQVARQIDGTAVDLLVNDGRTLEIDGARLHIVGTDNTGFGQKFADLPRAMSALRRTDGDEATVLLAHDPTFWDTHVRQAAPDIDLMLSGHTHGGQVGFEVGPARWSLARVMYQRWAGLYEEESASPHGKQYLYVNRGLGTVGPPIRLGIRPEITMLTLRAA
jgi:uncharacterized protein